MKNFIVCSFGIEGHASMDALRNSLDRFDVQHDLVLVNDKNGKSFNFSQAFFMKIMLVKHQCPVVWMDPETHIIRFPVQFNIQSTMIALYSHDISTRLDTAVIYMRNHRASMELLDMWILNNTTNPETWESENLRAAIFIWHKRFYGQIGMLPPSYSPGIPGKKDKVITRNVINNTSQEVKL